MPIPRLEGDMTRAQIVKAYNDLDWHKMLDIDWVVVSRDGSIKLMKYRFNADAMPCSDGSDNQYQLTFVQIRPHGVVWTCGICRRTMGPIAFESGVILNPPVGDDITIREAWDIIKETGQMPPIGLPPMSGTDKLRIIG